MFRVKIRLAGIVLILVGLSAACSFFGNSTTKKAAPDELFFVQKYNTETKILTRGFMDKTGKIVLGPWESFEWNGKKYGGDSYKAPFFSVLPFIEGLAGICFYDETSMSVYNEARADLEKGKCGFIDKTGKIVIEPKYKQIGYFSEGLAAVSEESDKYTAKFGYIDRTGKLIIEPKFHSKGAFNDGLAAASAKVGEDSKAGYIDQTGKFVIETKYAGILNSFRDGHTIIDSPQKVIIDKTGKEIKAIETESAGNTDYYYQTTLKSRFYDGYAVDEFSAMTAFNEGLTMSFSRGKSVPIGYVNTKGELEIKLDPLLVGQIRPFSEGFAPIGWEVQDKDKLTAIMGAEAMKDFYDWTYIDRKGNVKVPLNDTFQDARPFAEGMAAVKPRPNDKGNWGFINPEFKLAIPACFEKVADFRGGLASVLVYNYPKEIKGCESYDFGTNNDDRNVYIDKTGKIIKPQW